MALIDYDAANYPGIRIDDPGGSSSFALSAKEALDKIRSKPLGQRLLAEISARNATCAFATWGGIIKIYRALLPIDQGGSKAAAVNELNATNGTGTASGVAWNSNVYKIPQQGQRPPFIGLAHELIHAWHNAWGTKQGSYDDEENFTVGLAQFILPDPTAVPATITENMIRLEHGIPIRHRY
jgi:hypothetical protein